MNYSNTVILIYPCRDTKQLRAVPEIILGGGVQARFCPVGEGVLLTCPRGWGGDYLLLGLKANLIHSGAGVS